MASRRSRHHRLDVWPGFVDALSAMLMIIVLVLVLLMVSQFFLSSSLSEKTIEVGTLSAKLAELSKALGLEQREKLELRELTEEQRKLLEDAARKQSGLSQEIEDLGGKLESEKAEKEALEEHLASQIVTLNDQLSRLNAALETAETTLDAKNVEIKTLSQKLNEAMVSKMEELAQYRSEFFGRLKQALGQRQDIRVAGDRFIFQSEVLFPTASAQLEPRGAVQLSELASTLKEIMSQIPSDIDWVLQVIGHTDKRPISTDQFRSNWELSAARAISVVKFLVEQGIPAERLAASGYAEFDPMDSGDDEQALARNRRIELKLTEK